MPIFRPFSRLVSTRFAALALVIGLFASACSADFDIDSATDNAIESIPDSELGEKVEVAPEPDPPSESTPEPEPSPPTPDDNPPDGQDPVEAVKAEFVPGDCDFDVPTDAVIECGSVSVPESYADLDGTKIEIGVAILRSDSDDKSSTPTIYLEGGPGGHAIETIPFSYEDRYLRLLELGDVIVVDQRGTGTSKPRLVCPEADDAYEIINADPNLSADEIRSTVLDGLGQCSTRLTDSGIDLTQYNTENNAHDIDMVRAAYGADQLDLFGISYGTRLGLAIMRLHPDRVRTAVLDSTLPPEVDATADTQASLIRSYERVIAACKADIACTDEFGDLDARFRALYDQLEDDPIDAVATNFLTAETTDTTVDGDALISITFGALYDAYSFTDLPELIADLEEGNTEIVEKYLDLDVTNEDFFSLGMFLSFACHDEVAFSSIEAVDAIGISDPLFAKALETSENVGSFAFDVCEVWGAGSAPDGDNEPVTGAIPTLFLAGGFDPVTPPEWAIDAAASLDNAQVLTFPTLSHGVTGDQCGMDIAAAFIANPNTIDISCIDDLPAPGFAAPAIGAVEIEPYSVDIEDFAATVSSVRPVAWTSDPTGVQSTRGASIIDETAIIQLGGQFSLAENLATLVGDQLSIDMAETEPEDIAGRSWRHIGGSANGIALDVWIETDLEFAPIVMLISGTPERSAVITLVVEPALAAIEVQPL